MFFKALLDVVYTRDDVGPQVLICVCGFTYTTEEEPSCTGGASSWAP